MPVSPPHFINQAVQGHTTSHELSQNCLLMLEFQFWNLNVSLLFYTSLLFPHCYHYSNPSFTKEHRKKGYWSLLTPMQIQSLGCQEALQNSVLCSFAVSIVQSNFNLNRHQILISFSVSEWPLDSHKFYPLSNNFFWWLAGGQATLGRTDSQEHKQ